MMKQINSQKSIIKQKGAAVLLVSIVLLIGVTLITIFAARVGVMDQRIAANEYRHGEAQAAAHAALEQSSAFIENNISLYDGDSGVYPWKDCTDAAIKDDLPCTIGTTTYSLAYDGVIGTTTIDPVQYTATLASGIASDSYVVYKTSSFGAILTAIGVGKSLDGTGDAFSQVSYAKAEFITPGKIPPVLASGVGLNGSFTIVADPRLTFDDAIACDTVTPLDVESTTGSDGKALGNLSLWVNAAGSSGTWQTCSIDYFVDDGETSLWGGDLKCVYEYDDTDDWGDCACDSDAHLSDSDNGGTTAGYLPTNEHPDIKGSWNVIEDFPDSPFSHFFNGKTVGDVKGIAIAEGTYVEGNCVASDFTNYTNTKRPIVWVTGNCGINDIGSQTDPIIVVVEGKITVNGNTDAWGVILGLGDFTVNGGAVVHGALIMEDAATYTFKTLGNYHQVYDFCVMSNLQDDSVNTDIAKLKYSAKDFKL